MGNNNIVNFYRASLSLSAKATEKSNENRMNGDRVDRNDDGRSRHGNSTSKVTGLPVVGSRGTALPVDGVRLELHPLRMVLDLGEDPAASLNHVVGSDADHSSVGVHLIFVRLDPIAGVVSQHDRGAVVVDKVERVGGGRCKVAPLRCERETDRNVRMCM